MRERSRVATVQHVDVRLDPVEEFRIGDRAGLDDLGDAGRQFAVGQRRQRADVRDHGLRLVNAPIMFLPSGWLMPVLPPTDESTCDSSVVGTWMNGTPRM